MKYFLLFHININSFLLRGLGAFYIKRKIDGEDGKKDYIYRGLLQTYMEESISAEHNIEFFIEGGRTRTGKPGLPKVCFPTHLVCACTTIEKIAGVK